MSDADLIRLDPSAVSDVDLIPPDPLAVLVVDRIHRDPLAASVWAGATAQVCCGSRHSGTVLKPNSGVIPRPKAEESQFLPASRL